MQEIQYTPIGVIHSPFKDVKGMPIQPTAAKGIAGTVEIEPEYCEGLEDVRGFSHVMLIYHFHRSKGFSLKVKPFMDDTLRGVFATRAPRRPNPVGISVVRLVRVEGCTLFIEDVDILDGTPLLDMKPYVPEFDVREVTRTGWLSKRAGKVHEARADERFSTSETLDVKSVFDTMVEKYDAWYDSEEGRPLYESELRCLGPMVQEAQPPILEVGAGTGRFAMHFPEVTGVDPSLNALKLAAARGVKTVQGRGESLPFDNESFGCILIIMTLCFVKDPLKVLVEAKRVLKKGGNIIIGLVPKDSPWGAFYEEKKRLGHPFYQSATFHSLTHVKKLLKDAGLKIERIRSTLLQRPEGPRRIEEPVEGHVGGAGFLCIEVKHPEKQARKVSASL